MNKQGPGIGGLAAIVGFALSVVLLLTFLWIAFGGSLPTAPEGYRFRAAFPEAALLVDEADVRMAGVNVGKVKDKDLAPGGRRTIAEIEVDDRFAPVKRDARVVLRQKSLLGETYVELAPGSRDAPDLPEGALLPRTHVKQTVELDEIFSAFDPRTRRYFQEWLRESGIATSGTYAADFNDSLGNSAPFFTAGARTLRPLAEQDVALRRLVRNTGRVARAVSADGHSLRDLITGGGATFAALAARDEALADTFQVLPTFLRETRATVARLERFARNTDPLVRDLRQPVTDLAPTLRDVADLSPDLEHLFNSIGPLVTASETGVPAADRLLDGVQPTLAAAHVFLPELNPILAYLSFSREQLATFLAPGGSALGGNGIGGYRSSTFAEHYLPQSAIIDSRSLQRRTSRPAYERANAYVAPNAWERSIGLGAIEAFDCDPSGGERRNPSGTAANAAPPCFVAPPLLFQDQRYPRLRKGRAPHVDAPAGRQGNEPAVP
ncbi:MAG: MCE family protein [Thermoleophilaceae bacterium]|nr:MCE family protein [Thermoleophilaceae bacterium]